MVYKNFSYDGHYCPNFFKLYRPFFILYAVDTALYFIYNSYFTYTTAALANYAMIFATFLAALYSKNKTVVVLAYSMAIANKAPMLPN